MLLVFWEAVRALGTDPLLPTIFSYSTSITRCIFIRVSALARCLLMGDPMD